MGYGEAKKITGYEFFLKKVSFYIKISGVDLFRPDVRFLGPVPVKPVL